MLSGKGAAEKKNVKVKDWTTHGKSSGLFLADPARGKGRGERPSWMPREGEIVSGRRGVGGGGRRVFKGWYIQVHSEGL